MMQLRITDTALPNDELILDVDPDDWPDSDEPSLDEGEVQELIDWWAGYNNRTGEILEDHGIAVLVEVTNMQNGPMIGTWWQTDSDTHWELRSFPFTTLNFEEVPQ